MKQSNVGNYLLILFTIFIAVFVFSFTGNGESSYSGYSSGYSSGSAKVPNGYQIVQVNTSAFSDNSAYFVFNGSEVCVSCSKNDYDIIETLRHNFNLYVKYSNSSKPSTGFIPEAKKYCKLDAYCFTDRKGNTVASDVKTGDDAVKFINSYFGLPAIGSTTTLHKVIGRNIEHGFEYKGGQSVVYESIHYDFNGLDAEIKNKTSTNFKTGGSYDVEVKRLDDDAFGSPVFEAISITEL